MSAVPRFRPGEGRAFVNAPIPRAWHGSTAIIIAAGASVTPPQLNTARDAWAEGRVRVIGVNNVFQYAPWVDALYACDPTWWHKHVKQVRDTNITTLYCQDRETCERYGLWWTPGKHKSGVSTNPAFIHYGLHSGFQALNVCVHLGARRILLVGFDCKADDRERPHFFGKYGDPVFDVKPDYSRWVKHYLTAQAGLIDAGVRVINCSPGSAITAFPHTTLGKALGIR